MTNQTPARSSTTLLCIVVTMLGAVMLKLAGTSPFSLLLGTVVLLMGLAATTVMLLRASRQANDPVEVTARPPVGVEPPVSTLEVSSASMGSVIKRLLESYSLWWDANRDSLDVWPAWDRWLRDTLHDLARAERIRCFRVTEPDGRLASLANELEEPLWLDEHWRPLIDHVIATGRIYLRGAPGAGELLASLGALPSSSSPSSPQEPPLLLLPIQDAGCTIGLLLIGQVGSEDWLQSDFVEPAGRVIELMWRQVALQSELSDALATDRVSGVLNRQDFTAQAEQVLYEAAGDDEPLVLMTLGIEGLRKLDAERHWELQNWLMQQMGRVLRRRLRSDDLVGRFADDRFVAVLRRLDVGLGELIARKVLASAQEAIRQGDTPLQEITVRCGLAADMRHGLEDALGRASDALHEARTRNCDLAIDGTSRPQHAAVAGAVS